jgi:hypothetical protein
MLMLEQLMAVAEERHFPAMSEARSLRAFAASAV